MFAKVEEWKRSGLSLREFSLTIGISKSAFDYWVRKERRFSNNSPSFVELSPLVRPTVSNNTIIKHPETDTQAQLVITFPSGMCIKVYG